MEFTWFDDEDIAKLNQTEAEEFLVMDLTPEKIEIYADGPGVLRTH